MSYKNFAILIPSRIGSTRLKNKALIEIDKKPLIEHVIRGAIKSNLKVPIIVATDTKDIVNIAERCGQIGMLTSKDHKSGSDRIYEALEKFDPQKKIKKIIHLQGDLPNVSKKLIKSSFFSLETSTLFSGIHSISVEIKFSISFSNSFLTL